MIFKCKICGGELNIQKGQSIVECEYCGVKQTLPRFLDENTKLMYDRANSYLLHNEFDKAENIYNQILLADKEDAEAYWNLVLCKYGVTYVKDPASGKYIPTCNRTHYASVFNDENYKNAIKYADAEKAELYEQDATTIDDIQRGILSISKHEKPFDIFISYKETGENGARTKDSIKAQELYDKLTAEGYKVFFSRITLEDKIGTEYEPYIYAALASSKIMLVIGSSKDNLEAVWVKNEWSRYLSFVQRDSEKTLIPLYFDMDKADLPEEFAHLTAYDMTVDGFEQELIRGIKKLIPLPVMLLERKKKFRKKLKIAGVAVLALAVIGGIASVPWFMKLPDYNAAMQLYYDKNYPEAAWAFADLGSYRDSEEMKDKCERSWRNSLVSVATANEMSNSIAGAYYVSPNGTVESKESAGSSNNNIEINEHGKIVSIADNLNLYALHEDGYVTNAVENNQLENDFSWQDVIQISPVFNTTNIALKPDGTMIYGVTESKERNDNDNWLKPISEWKDIISFEVYLYRLGMGGVGDTAIVGIKSDGTLCAVVKYADNTVLSPDDILSNFYDVKKIDVFVESSSILNLNTKELSIVALTNHGTIQSYIDGNFTETDAPDAIDIYYNPYGYIDEQADIYELHSDGNLYEHGENKYLLSDVVYLSNSGSYKYAVTRSGNIYSLSHLSSNGSRDPYGKTSIHDEWLERMG